MKPQVVAPSRQAAAEDDAIVTSDSGTITTWWARHIKARRGQMFSCSGNLATMACGLPYAIAAQIAYPDRQVHRLRRRRRVHHADGRIGHLREIRAPVKMFVIKNNVLGQIKWEQMVFLGNPEYVCELQPIDFSNLPKLAASKEFA